MVSRARLALLVIRCFIALGAAFTYCVVWLLFGEMYANAATIYVALMMLAASE